MQGRSVHVVVIVFVSFGIAVVREGSVCVIIHLLNRPVQGIYH